MTKQRILAALLAGAGLFGAGQVLAQENSPAFTGTQPGIAHPEYGPANPYGNSGWTPDRAFRSIDEPPRSRYYYGTPDILTHGPWGVVQPPPRARNNRDRDRDGVPDNRDRYPADPHRR